MARRTRIERAKTFPEVQKRGSSFGGGEDRVEEKVAREFRTRETFER